MNLNNSPLALIRQNATEVLDRPQDFDALLDAIGNCRFVLLGEASYGTHEFYKTRAQITTRLIEEKGFGAVAVEADWSDAYRVNRYVRSIGDDPDPMSGLGDFLRFPRWMWRNTDVADFISVLKYYNEGKTAEKQVGFYGLDLYNMYASIDKVIGYLDEVDSREAQKVRRYYSYFDLYDHAKEKYAMSIVLTEDCQRKIVVQLEELRKNSIKYMKNGGFTLKEEQFVTEQYARVAHTDEQYYKNMFSGRVSCWNQRDKNMADTLDALAGYLKQYREPKIVVWGHNSHIGDARSTEVSLFGRLNLGQLVRERYKDEVYLIGFTTHSGTVTAASFWGEAVQRKNISLSTAESFEHLFHRSEIPSFYLNVRDNKQLPFLANQHLERAIGVVYMPELERQNHYFRASLSGQFDAVIHFDKSIAVQPLDHISGWEEGLDSYRSAL